MNGIMAWIMAITICFAVVTMDLAEVLSTPTGYPHGRSPELKVPSQHVRLELTWEPQSLSSTTPSITLHQPPQRSSCGPP